MSLINDMLNDLERRRSQENRGDVDLSWFIAEDRRPELVKKPHFWVFAVLLLAVSISAALHFLNPVAQPDEREAPLNPEYAQAGYVQQRSLPLPGPQTMEPGAAQATEVPATAKNERSAPAEEQHETVQSLPPQPQKTSAPPRAETGQPSHTVKLASIHQRPLPGGQNSLKKPRPLNAAQQDEKSYRNAQALIRRGNVLGAEELLRDRIDATATAVKSAQLLASLLLSEERHAALHALYQGLLLRGMESSELHTVMGRSYLVTGKPEQAVKLLSRSKPDVFEYPAYYEVLALAAQRSRSYELSAQTYQRLLQTDARRADWWIGLAIGFDQRQNFSAARVGYRRALRGSKLSPALETYAKQRLAEIGTPPAMPMKDQ